MRRALLVEVRNDSGIMLGDVAVLYVGGPAELGSIPTNEVRSCRIRASSESGLELRFTASGMTAQSLSKIAI
jgi:hypothetical protein